MKQTWKSWGFWTSGILIWELVLLFSTTKDLSGIVTLVCFTVVAAGLVAFLTNLPGWAGRICGWILPPVLFLIFAVQLVYDQIFGSLLSLSFVSMGAAAITTFWSTMMGAIAATLPQLSIMLLPLIAFYILRRKWMPVSWDLRWRLGQLGGCAVLAVLLMLLGGGQQANATIDQWASRYGLLTAEVLDLKQLITGSADELTPKQEMSASAQYSADEWNVMEQMDYIALQDMTEDEALQQINAYIAGQEPTAKNAYTGYFEGYNLIVVCAESFSPYMISEELTPTLYKMINGGFVFENFYNSFPNMTTNGEYSLCMGMMPDFSRMSFSASTNNYWPFNLGNIFTDAGMTAIGYHNNVGTFYNRHRTHPNMGYDFRAIGYGLDMVEGHPSSDLEMMEKSVDDYIGSEPFHAYYMTYSGHASYDFETQDMAIKNQDLVNGISGSEGLRSYYAANLELEFAMAHLLERLEEAGIADRTVIVLTGDHIPYGLEEADYAQLAGDAVNEPFWQYKNCFICWNSAMEEPVAVDEYCCTQDILPTLLNLFGFEYDSRMLSGRDVLADGDHLAILKDSSFLTRGLYYDAVTAEAVWEGEPDEERLTRLLQTVSEGFTLGRMVLEHDYYGFAFGGMGLYDASQREYVPSFTDISGAWYESAVEELTMRGVYQGAGDGVFGGENLVTRAQFVSIVSRGLQIQAVSTEHPYEDVQMHWYTDGVTACYSNGLLPEGETSFRADDYVTVEEMEYTMIEAAKFADIPFPRIWTRNLIAEALENQKTYYPDLPDGVVSRGTFAHIIYEMAIKAGIE